jgi:hypothetical protein
VVIAVILVGCDGKPLRVDLTHARAALIAPAVHHYHTKLLIRRWIRFNPSLAQRIFYNLYSITYDVYLEKVFGC